MGSLIGQVLNAAAPAQLSSSPPVPSGGGYAPLPGGMTGQSPDTALLRAYNQNGTNYSNVSLLASSVAAQKWQLFRTAPQGARYTTSERGSDPRQQVFSHAALNVLQHPASVLVQTPRGERRVTIWDRFGLFEVSQIWMEQTGKAHWVVDYAEDTSPIPLGLWPVRPDRMIPVPDRDRYLAGWLYRSPDGQELIPLRLDEVIWNRYPDPEDPYGGAGPIRPVLTDIEAADYAALWNKNYFTNSAEPGGIIEVPGDLSDEDFDTLTSRWRETHRGVARAHRIAVLEAGAKWVPNSYSAKDMDFANLRNISRDIIRESLGMHKVMTGVVEDVNRANAQSGEEIFATWKVAPRLDRWKNVLDTQFLPLFGATAQGLETDYLYPSPTSREQDNAELSVKVTGYLTLITAGVDPDAAADTVGLPRMAMAERAAQAPGLPPGWVPEMAPEPGGGGAPPPVPADALRAAAGWDSPGWAAVDAAASRQRELAIWNSLARAS